MITQSGPVRPIDWPHRCNKETVSWRHRFDEKLSLHFLWKNCCNCKWRSLENWQRLIQMERNGNRHEWCFLFYFQFRNRIDRMSMFADGAATFHRLTHPSLSIFPFFRKENGAFGDPGCLFHLNKMIWHLLISASAVSHEKVSRFFVNYSRTMKDESCLLIEMVHCYLHFAL